MKLIYGVPYPDAPVTEIKMSQLNHVCNGGQLHSTTALLYTHPLRDSSEEDLVGAMVQHAVQKESTYPVPDKAILIVEIVAQAKLISLLQKLEKGEGTYLTAERLTHWRESYSDLWIVRGLHYTEVQRRLNAKQQQQPAVAEVETSG